LTLEDGIGRLYRDNIGTIFKSQRLEDCLTLEDGIDRLYRNIGDYFNVL